MNRSIPSHTLESMRPATGAAMASPATTTNDARGDGATNQAATAHQRLVTASGLAQRRVNAAGVDTAVLEGGDGPPMLFLHGQGEYWAVWLSVIDDLVTTHRLVIADLPGHGGSGMGSARLDGDMTVAWLDELIDATCDQPPVVVGHLLGGAIAARHAIAHHDRAAHVVLVDTLGLGWFRPALRFALPMIRFMVRPTPQSRDRLFRECFVDFDQTGDNFGDRWDDLRDYALDRARNPTTQAALRSLMPRVGMPAIPPDDLASITTPTTLIHGRRDLQVDVSLAQEASARHGWPLHVIEGARDDPAAECPVDFIAALRSAITAHPATPGAAS